MGLSVWRIILIVLVVVCVALAVACHVIAIATDYWLQSSAPEKNNFLNIGLWKACFHNYVHRHEKDGPTYRGCHDLYSDVYENIRDWLVPAWLISCRAIAVIGFFLQVIGIVLVVILLIWVLCEAMRCCDDEAGWCDRCIIYLTPIFWILAGVFIMSAAMVFGDNAFRLQCKDFWVGGGVPNENHLAWSWGFEVAACILSFISGGLIIWLAVKTARDRKYAYYSTA